MILSGSTKIITQFSAVMCFCYHENGGLILLQKRMDHKLYPGLWGIPAGKVEPEENIMDAMIREIKEETGNEVPAKMLELVFVTNHRHSIRKGGSVLYFKGFTFISNLRLKKVILDEREHASFVTIKPYLVPAINRRIVIPDTIKLHEKLAKTGKL